MVERRRLPAQAAQADDAGRIGTGNRRVLGGPGTPIGAMPPAGVAPPTAAQSRPVPGSPVRRGNDMPGKRMGWVLKAVLSLLTMVAWLGVAHAESVPKAQAWPLWQAHDESNAKLIDHSLWAEFLERRLKLGPDGITRVDYAGAQGNDRARLGVYITQMERVPILQYPRDEQQAFWINLYNAAVVKIILDWYPRASIQDILISPGLSSKGPWQARFLTVEKQNLSLDDIEHHILRPLWNDPRSLYALCPSAISGPNLAPRPYTGLALQAQLDAAAHAYVNDPRGARVERGKLRLSALYDLYEADFGGDKAAVLAHLRQYADTPLASALEGVKRYATDKMDWTLNDAARAPH